MFWSWMDDDSKTCQAVIFPSRVRELQDLISEHKNSTRTGLEMTRCITQQICGSKLQQTYFTLLVQRGVIRVMERLWSCYAHCSDLQRRSETITIVWTVSIATILSLAFFLRVCVRFGDGGAVRNQLVLHPVIPADTFIPFDDKCTDTEKSSRENAAGLNLIIERLG